MLGAAGKQHCARLSQGSKSKDVKEESVKDVAAIFIAVPSGRVAHSHFATCVASLLSVILSWRHFLYPALVRLRTCSS